MTDLLECGHPDCSRTIKNHKWGKTKAEAWFQQQDGTVWCPDHIPEWVASWRRRKAEQ